MDYTQVVAEGRIEKLKEIAENIVDNAACKVIKSPAPGMIMLKEVDPLEKTPFYLGEAFVTECEVQVDSGLGYSCVLGENIERALYGGIIDAVIGNKHKLAEITITKLSDEEGYIREKLIQESKEISKTKVNFDVKKG